MQQAIQQVQQLSSGQSIADLAFDRLGDSLNFRELADFNELDIFDDLPIDLPIEIPNPQDLQAMAREKVRDALSGVAGDLDLSAIAAGRVGGVDINQAIKLVDFLYG